MIPDNIKNLQTGHVGLNVSDLDRSKGFYQQVFGLEVMGESQEEGRRFVFLSEGNTLI
ncbi:MAG: VOC family protein, partial [Nitrospiraceae bacterium]